MVQGKVKRIRKQIKKVLPVTIRNKVRGKEELLQCLIDEDGRFKGFAEVSKVRDLIYWFKRNKHKKLKVFRRMQVVQRERIVKRDKRQPISAAV